MTVIGRFKETYHDDRLPSIFSAIHENPPKEKGIVLEYLKHGELAAVSPGYLVDQVNGHTQIKNLACYQDDSYLWRSDVVYYYEHYNIDLPGDFVEHVLKKMKP